MEKKKQSKKPDDLNAYYRNTFASMEGQKVLKDILVKGRFFEEIKNEEDRIKHNFCKEIISMCGGFNISIAGIHE